jgi:cytochrome P450
MAMTAGDLGSLPLFQDCTEADLVGVAKAIREVRHVDEGEVVCAEGEPADRWWIVVEGFADVTSYGLYLATIGPGETIGELALLDGAPRTATVKATTDMVLQEIGADGFLRALAESPNLSLALLRQLAGRMRRANERTAPPSVPAATPSSPRPAAPSGPVPTQLDPRAEGYFDDPYRYLGMLRERAPVHFSEAIGAWVLTRYDDVHRLTRDRSMLGSAATRDPIATLVPESPEAVALHQTDKAMIQYDGADHLRLRRLVSMVFTPRAIQRWRERAASVVERLLAETAEKDKVDVLADYALPLPVQIISEMLGMPLADVPQLREWSRVLVRSIDPVISEEEGHAARVAGREMSTYVAEVVADKRQHLADDILSGLIQAEESGDRLDAQEILAQVMMLYIAGHETTTNLIGNGLTALFSHPEQRDALCADPGLDANAVEEVLRFDSPAQFTRRVNREPLPIGEVTVPRGSLIFLALGSANHDQRKWGPTADLLDVARSGANEHVSFGGGAHFCLGASLARMEGQVALPRLVRRFPRMEPAYGEPSWVRRMTVRGVDSLPVVLR